MKTGRNQVRRMHRQIEAYLDFMAEARAPVEWRTLDGDRGYQIRHLDVHVAQRGAYTAHKRALREAFDL